VAEFHSCGSRLPERGVVGDAYFDAFNRQMYIAIADGRLVPLESLLAGPAVQGIDGKDSTVPGPPGAPGRDSTVPGPQGPRGEKGDVLYVSDSELAAAVEAWKQKYIDAEARWHAALDVTMLEAFRNNPRGAVTIQSYLNRVRHHRGDTHQGWSPKELKAIRDFISGGGNVADLIAKCVKG
jgi:hypothetical protein